MSYLSLKLVRVLENWKLTTLARCLLLFLFMSPVDYLGWKIAQEGTTQIPFACILAVWVILLVVPLLTAVQLAIYGRDFLFRFIRTVTLMLLPMFPLNVARVGWALRRSGESTPLVRAANFRRQNRVASSGSFSMS
jgi:hypothetical protein